MTFNECSSKTVAGDIMATNAIDHGTDLTPNMVEQLGDSGLVSYTANYNKTIADNLNKQPFSLDRTFSVEQETYWQKAGRQFKDNYKGPDDGTYQQAAIKNVLHDVATPESVLGSDIIDEFDTLLQDLAEKNIYSGKDYIKEVDSFFASVDEGQFNDSQRIYWQKFKNSYSRSSLPSSEKGGLLSKVDALRKGVVVGSPTVIAGNFVEPFVKGVPLYKGNFFKGIKNFVDEHGVAGLFKEVPELQKQGLYGLDIGDRSPTGWLERSVGVLDRPSKNIMYYVGLADGGTELAGRKAVQNVLFLPRLGNMPLAYRTPTGRVMTGLLSYSIGTMQLFTDVINNAIRRPSPENLANAAGLFGSFALVAGVPYVYSDEVEEIPMIGKLWKAASGVSSVNVPNRVFITASIFNNSIAKPIGKVGAKLFKGEFDEITPQDVWATSAAAAFLASGQGSGLETIAGNSAVKRSVRNTIDVITGEKEAGEAFSKVFMPWERD